MLDYSISQPEGILELAPHTSLSKEDFDGLNTAINAYLADHTKLQGILIHSMEFPGWEDFGGLAAHMHFVGHHDKSVERVAIVTDSHFAGIAASLGNYLTSAEIRHFPFIDDAKARHWLETAPVQLSTSAKNLQLTS
ncbi:STAS/SEC14 domain-containing protein [Solimicrobium silvestre]|uniref:SpoIIAA-like n=1 Tax=Solimicrobium silvestre TaxID=2099400 RepID=A0A2S9GWV6_9BURK|nr:STAS/SEC14 domain-containing protein [Solimicrobium silvestre]PRC92200.1 hypothetical protein S2091_3116 [Solimicrobium silvestre]